MGKLNKLNLLIHPVNKEFRVEKCGFDHTPADDFVKSQWQSCSKSTAYLIYRWFLALFFIAAVLISIFDPDEENFWHLYLIYMTNWGILLCMFTHLLLAILVSIWHFHPEYADRLINLQSLTSPFRIYWAMHITSLVTSIVITIIYWSILYNPEENKLSAANLLTHAFNSVGMFIDLLIVAHPLRLLHMFLPVCFGLIYTAFSFVYQRLGGLNKKGKPFIYHVLDWSKPNSAALTVVGVLLLCCIVYMALFTIYKLRSLIYKRLHNASFFLPSTNNEVKNKQAGEKNSKSQETGMVIGIQHSPQHISMALGNYTGYDNHAFSASKDNIQSVHI